MSLPAHVRRERRAYAKKDDPPKKYPRRRCLNCNAFFPRTRKNRKFCKPECKDEYNRYGSAFGPLKEWLAKYIEKAAAEKFVEKMTAFLKTDEGRAAIAVAVEHSSLAAAMRETLNTLTTDNFNLAARIVELEKKKRRRRRSG